MPSTIAQRFAENTEALNNLTLAVETAIANSSSIGGRPVDLTGLVDGVLLQYQATGNKWVVITPDALKLALDLPANFAVDLTGVADGYTLAWDAAQSRFEPVPPLGNTGGGTAVAANIAAIRVTNGATKTVSLGIVDTTSQSQSAGGSTTPQPQVPTLTSDISGSPILVGSGGWGVGIRTASDTRPNPFPAGTLGVWNLFDGIAETQVQLNNSNSTDGGFISDAAPARLVISFPSSTRITAYSVQCGTITGLTHLPTPGSVVPQAPIEWKLQGKDGTLSGFTDDSGWVDVDTRTLLPAAWSPYEAKTFNLGAAATYRHWRLRITKTALQAPSPWVGTYPPELTAVQLFGGASATGSVTASYAAGPQRAVYESRLFAIAADDTRVICSVGVDERSDRVFVINTNSKAITQDFALSGADIYRVQYNLLSPNNAFLYSTATEASGRISIQDTENRAYLAAGNKILEVAIDAQTTTTIEPAGASTFVDLIVVGSKLYAVDANGGRVVVIDRATRTQTATVTVGTAPSGIAYDPVQQTLFVTNSGSNNVTLVSSVTDTPITTVAVGSFPIAVGVDSVTGRAVIANRDSGNVTILNTISGAAVGSVAIGTTARPTAVAIDPVNGRAFVACEGYHQLVAIRLDDNQLVARIPVAPEPISATFVEATSEVYAASRDGSISVVKSLASA